MDGELYHALNRWGGRIQREIRLGTYDPQALSRWRVAHIIIPKRRLRVSATKTLFTIPFATQHTSGHTAVVAHSAVTRVPVVAPPATLTLIALGVIAAKTHAGLTIANAELHVAVSVTIALATAQRRGRVPVTSCLTFFTVASSRPVLTLVADTWSLKNE